MKTLRGMLMAPGCKPKLVELVTGEDSALEALQAMVGGYIEAVPLARTSTGGEVVLWLNEEGLLMQLPPNVRVDAGQVFVGNLFVTESEDGETISLSEEGIRVVERFAAIAKRYASQCPRCHSAECDRDDCLSQGVA